MEKEVPSPYLIEYQFPALKEDITITFEDEKTITLPAGSTYVGYNLMLDHDSTLVYVRKGSKGDGSRTILRKNLFELEHRLASFGAKKTTK